MNIQFTLGLLCSRINYNIQEVFEFIAISSLVLDALKVLGVTFVHWTLHILGHLVLAQRLIRVDAGEKYGATLAFIAIVAQYVLSWV